MDNDIKMIKSKIKKKNKKTNKKQKAKNIKEIKGSRKRFIYKAFFTFQRMVGMRYRTTSSF